MKTDQKRGVRKTRCRNSSALRSTRVLKLTLINFSEGAWYCGRTLRHRVNESNLLPRKCEYKHHATIRRHQCESNMLNWLSQDSVTFSELALIRSRMESTISGNAMDRLLWLQSESTSKLAQRYIVQTWWPEQAAWACSFPVPPSRPWSLSTPATTCVQATISRVNVCCILVVSAYERESLSSRADTYISNLVKPCLRFCR